MLYPFPIQNNSRSHFPYVQEDSGLDDKEIKYLIEQCEPLEKRSVKLYGHYTDENVKATGSYLLYKDNVTSWIYSRMRDVIIRVNESHYQYDISGFAEHLYYLKYEAPTDHFNWHIDTGSKTPVPRKLSAVLQLSDPSEYDGGEFDVMVTDDYARADKGKGIITIFPSFKIHRVTPVTRGTRRTLTMFVTGPNFR